MKAKRAIFILFGGTGDLTKRKLVPAFASLVHDNKIKKDSSIIGVARKDFSDEEYKKFLIDSVGGSEDKKKIKSLNVRYVRGDFSDQELFARLKNLLRTFEPMEECNKIFYLATSFEFFPKIVEELGNMKYSLKNSFSKVVFEKPFGADLKSFDELERGIHKIFPEDDVYRIDHYLAKDTVQNINVLKFVNPMFYGTFNNKYVDSIKIVIDESLEVGNRINYYDDAGAIKDMIQSHLLQILARLLMVKPKILEYENLHREKIRVLRNLEISDVKDQLLAQYKSYSKELDLAGKKKSNTETFAKIVMNCKTPEWNGVKLILRTGKKLSKKLGQIIVGYKLDEQSKKMWNYFSNDRIILNIYPKQDVSILMNAKDPLKEKDVRPIEFNFCHECEFGPNTVDTYASLIEDVIEGRKMMFAKGETVRECWKVTEKILKIKKEIKFIKYDDGRDPEN